MNQIDQNERIILKLYHEYNSTLEEHRIPLRSVTLRLFDSQTLWGKWDPETRTIFISQKLVENYAWFFVTSVLKHEMAHQLASERYGSRSMNHDDLFHQCCIKLGVPEEFCGASVDIQETELDWKKTRQSEESDKLFQKVQKLLALATSSNEHEALLAMSKVRELYAKYNLERYSFENKGNKENLENLEKNIAHIIICHKKKRIEAHQDKIFGILVGHFFVRAIYQSEYDYKTGERYRAVALVGTKENVLMAEYVYYFLLQQTESLVRQFKKRHRDLSFSTRKLSRFDLKSYRLGILEGFSEKLSKQDQQHLNNYKVASYGNSSSSQNSMNSSSHQTNNISSPFSPSADEKQIDVLGKALTLFEQDDSLGDYIQRIYPHLGNHRSGVRYINGDIYSAGKIEGERIVLNKAMSHQAGNSGRFLTES